MSGKGRPVRKRKARIPFSPEVTIRHCKLPNIDTQSPRSLEASTHSGLSQLMSSPPQNFDISTQSVHSPSPSAHDLNSSELVTIPGMGTEGQGDELNTTQILDLQSHPPNSQPAQTTEYLMHSEQSNTIPFANPGLVSLSAQTTMSQRPPLQSYPFQYPKPVSFSQPVHSTMSSLPTHQSNSIPFANPGIVSLSAQTTMSERPPLQSNPFQYPKPVSFPQPAHSTMSLLPTCHSNSIPYSNQVSDSQPAQNTTQIPTYQSNLRAYPNPGSCSQTAQNIRSLLPAEQANLISFPNSVTFSDRQFQNQRGQNCSSLCFGGAKNPNQQLMANHNDFTGFNMGNQVGSCDNSIIPVGAGLKEDIVKQILDNKYIDFSKYLLDHDELSDSDDEAEGSYDVKQGVLTLKPKKGKKKFMSFQDWVGCWNTYTAIILESFPDVSLVGKFAKHLEIVKKLSKAGKDWRHYDKIFRKLVAVGKASWGTVKSELYNESFLREAKGKKVEIKKTKLGLCFAFQHGTCRNNPCPYKHQCDNCYRIGHGRHRCQARQQKAYNFASVTRYLPNKPFQSDNTQFFRKNTKRGANNFRNKFSSYNNTWAKKVNQTQTSTSNSN